MSAWSTGKACGRANAGRGRNDFPFRCSGNRAPDRVVRCSTIVTGTARYENTTVDAPTHPAWCVPSVDRNDLDEVAIVICESKGNPGIQRRQHRPMVRREFHEVEVRDLTVSDEPADIDGRSGQ